MSIQSEIDPERRRVTTRAIGRVTPADVRSNQEALQTDPAFDSDYDHLFDLAGVDEFEASAAEVRALASFALFSEASRRAVVAPEKVLFGLSRMYQALRDAPEDKLKIFRTRDAALEWLESPGDHPHAD